MCEKLTKNAVFLGENQSLRKAKKGRFPQKGHRMSRLYIYTDGIVHHLPGNGNSLQEIFKKFTILIQMITKALCLMILGRILTVLREKENGSSLWELP